jgi:peroxiredoxin
MNFNRRQVTLSIAGIGALNGLVACGQDPAHVLIGKQVPNLVLTSIDGKKYDIANMKKPMILHFFGLWCSTCHADKENWEAVLKELNKISEIQIISIHSGKVPKQYDSLEKWNNKLDDNLKTPLIADFDNKISDTFPIPGYPSTLHVDSGGRIVEHSWQLRSHRGVKAFLMKTDKIFGLDRK